MLFSLLKDDRQIYRQRDRQIIDNVLITLYNLCASKYSNLYIPGIYNTPVWSRFLECLQLGGRRKQ